MERQMLYNGKYAVYKDPDGDEIIQTQWNAELKKRNAQLAEKLGVKGKA